MTKKTQEDVVVEKLMLDGHVSNFWAMENYILRLGSRINDLKKKGWIFETKWGEGSERKNYYYILKVAPTPTLF